LIWGLAVVAGEIIAYGGFPPLIYAILGFVIPLLIEVGIFTLNDYLDVDSDILNNRIDRPLTRNAISKQYPLYVSLTVLPVAAVLGAVMYLLIPFIIVLIFIGLGILYNVKLKEITMVKNVIMGLCIAAPLIGGNLVIHDHVLPIIMLFGTAAFISGFGREVLKDMMDIVGDDASGCTTLPLLYGLKKTAWVVSLSLIGGCALILFPFFYPVNQSYFHDYLYLILALLTSALSVYCAYSIIKNQSLHTIKILRKRSLYILETGIMAFIVGAIL
jgi:geranylgeranylglycerol-phosphate geranylgeranyltransferase